MENQKICDKKILEVISQHMVSTPGTETNREIVEDQRWNEFNSSIKLGFLFE